MDTELTTQPKMRKGLDITGSTLKWIAILTMLLNHVCYVVYQNFHVDNYFFTDVHWFLTRISFMLFAFMIAEGMHYTHDRKRYIFQLFLFAVISEIPYDLCFTGKIFDLSSVNVFFTLGLGALSIVGIDYFKGKPFFQIVAVFIAMIVSVYLKCEYSFLGIVTIASFYAFRNTKWKQLLFTSLIFTVFTFLFNLHEIMSLDGMTLDMLSYALTDYPIFWRRQILEQLHALVAIPLLAFYHGTKGKNINKYFFYCFYPGHLLLLWGIVRIVLLFVSAK